MNLIPTSTRPATITLYQGVPFDNKYKEHTLLSRNFTYDDREVSFNKNAFLDLKVEDSDEYYYPRTTKEGTFNFQYGNGLITAITLELDDNEINSNYMRVSIRGALPSRTISYYYFITGLTQKNETTYLLNLELDVIQTFGDEFLENMQDKPVMVERKHCTRVKENGNPHCVDIAKSENTFSGVKANNVIRNNKLSPKIYNHGTTTKIPFVKWVYFIFKTSTDGSSTSWKLQYRERGITYPYYVKALPLVDYFRIKGGTTANPVTLDYDVHNLIKKFSQSEECVKIVISPYPPFEDAFQHCSLEINRFIIDATNDTTPIEYEDEDIGFYFDMSEYCEFFAISTEFSDISLLPIKFQYVTLTRGFGGKIEFDSLQNGLIDVGNTPSIEHYKNANEYKIYLPPFRQYFLTSLSSQSTEFSPQLRFNNEQTLYDTRRFNPVGIISTNPASNFVFTTMMIQSDDVLTKNGDGGNLDYSLPTGANAYEHFMNSAMSEYTTSKTVSAITNALKIGVGIAGIAVGGVMGKVAGVAGVGAGIIGVGQTIGDYTAKMQDLKNTSISFNLGGSSFSRDYAMGVDVDYGNLFPFMVVYETDKSVIESASDYFYEYGYEVDRDCYFNTEIYRGNPQPMIDNNIFNRTNFNYVKINDDITMKCVGSNLPLIVAKKFNEIFNNGIKLWTFFGNGALDTGHNYDGIYDVYRYFQKHTYDNAEFYDQYE